MRFSRHLVALQQRLAELIERCNALGRWADALGDNCWRQRKQVAEDESKAAAAGDGALEGLVGRVVDEADVLVDTRVVVGGDLVARAAAAI